MVLHRVSGNRRLGLSLAAITALIWGNLPLMLQILLEAMDRASIVWYRFLISTLCLGGVLWWRGALPRLSALSRGGRVLLVGATAGLAVNYITFLTALDLTSPATSQVLIQLGPLLLALGGLVIFGEHFTPRQWAGFTVLVIGLGLFLAGQLDGAAVGADRTALGAAVLALSAASWAAYGLAQKQLLLQLRSLPLMFCLFGGCTICFTPVASPASIAGLDALGAAALVFSAMATTVAYGCFAAALDHVEASRVSAVIALVPLVTLVSVPVAGMLAPVRLPAESLSWLSLLGGLVVVAGSLLTALGAGDTGPPYDESEGGEDRLEARA